MKKKTDSKARRDALLLDGTIHYGVSSTGQIYSNGKPVSSTAAKIVAAKTTDIVPHVRPLNSAPKVTDVNPPKTAEKAVEGYGLQRCFNAIAKKNGEPVKTTFTGPALTGVARAIAANQALQKKTE